MDVKRLAPSLHITLKATVNVNGTQTNTPNVYLKLLDPAFIYIYFYLFEKWIQPAGHISFFWLQSKSWLGV